MIRKINITSRDQWLGLRKKCVVTASTVPALLTKHPYETAFSIWCRAQGLLGDSEENEAMAAGTDAELMMPARVKRLRPNLSLVKNNMFYFDDTLKFGATPDFLSGRSANWQAKCSSADIFYKDWKDGPPLWVQLQHQAEYMMTGHTSGGIICLVRDRHFSTYIYDDEPHEGAINAIREAVKEMRRRVEEDDPPAVDYQEDAERILSLLPKPTLSKVVDLTGDNRLTELLANYEQASEAEKAAQLTKKAIKAEVMTKVDDAEVMTCGTYRISAKTVDKKEHTVKASSYRDFRISKTGE